MDIIKIEENTETSTKSEDDKIGKAIEKQQIVKNQSNKETKVVDKITIKE